MSVSVYFLVCSYIEFVIEPAFLFAADSVLFLRPRDSSTYLAFVSSIENLTSLSLSSISPNSIAFLLTKSFATRFCFSMSALRAAASSSHIFFSSLISPAPVFALYPGYWFLTAPCVDVSPLTRFVTE